MRRLVSYLRDGRLLAGVDVDGVVVDLGAAGWGDGLATTVRAVLETGPGAVERAIEVAVKALSEGIDQGRSLDRVTLGPVISDPQKIICVGANYREHIEESGSKLPSYPEIFAKFPNALIGSGVPIPDTGTSSQIDFEGELAFIIGERCRKVSRDRALSVIAGYLPANDVSARDFQLRVRQWIMGKSFDGFLPLGPGLVPASQIRDPQSLDLTTRLNGKVMQHSNTSRMIFGIAELVTYLSSTMTLEPGDVVLTGTPSGVGLFRTPPVFLKDGDVIEIEIEGLGVLSNPVRNSLE